MLVPPPLTIRVVRRVTASLYRPCSFGNHRSKFPDLLPSSPPLEKEFSRKSGEAGILGLALLKRVKPLYLGFSMTPMRNEKPRFQAKKRGFWLGYVASLCFGKLAFYH